MKPLRQANVAGPFSGPSRQGRAVRTCTIALLLVSTGSPNFASPATARTWADEKCARYDKAFHEILDMVGREGVSDHFLKGNEAFIAAGCSNGADVCPQSPRDFDLANKLTLAAMGFGTASTFLPFVCRAQ